MEKIGLGKNEGNIEKHLTDFFGDQEKKSGVKRQGS
jgi:hypothetical protein